MTDTLAPSARVLRRRVVDNATGQTLEDTVFGYDTIGDIERADTQTPAAQPRTVQWPW